MGNAKGLLVRALTMDLVPLSMRGRWNSLLSISAFTWSGSAALGGIIADAAGDYRVTFIVTACIYSVSLVMQFPTLAMYRSRLAATAGKALQEQHDLNSASRTAPLTAPLLEQKTVENRDK